ncbi:MAG: LysM peptidoglycan-binding domain-containing protein [Bacteroidales bacterium]|nr:LysM peptidoglycan-binding domain-containing protein [Bacteroidales bacterium]
MIKSKRKLLHYCFLLVLSFGLIKTYAQNEKMDVEISSDKVIIDGVVYYVHMVKKGQTLYSISKAYNVPESSIIKENPGADISLKEGQALKIPKKVVYNEVTLDEKDKYIYHIIQQGETLYSLTQRYQITQKEIELHNPEVKYDALQVNQVIKIPRKIAAEQPKTSVVPEDSAFIYYRVKKKETLYSLTKRFNVTEEQLKAANEDLKHGVLKEGQIIRIPKAIDTAHTTVYVQPVDSLLLVETDTMVVNIDSLRALCDSFNYKANPVSFNVAVMLPFCLNERDLILNEDIGKDPSDNMKYYRLKKLRMLQEMSYSFSEFYEGILLGIEKMKNEGVNVNLYVYDTQRDSARVKKLLKGKEFENMNLIIGPVYNYCMQALYESLPPNQVTLVSPFCNSLDVPSQNPVFVTNPSNEILYERIADFMILKKNEKLVVVYSGDSNSVWERDIILNHFKSHNIPDTLFDVAIYNDTTEHQIYSALNKRGTTHMIVLTEDDVYLSKVIAKLNLVLTKHDVMLYGLPSWTKLMNIECEFYHQLQFSYGTPFKSELKNERYYEFQRNYYRYFSSLPCRTTSDGYNFALMGYDITTYFLSALKTHGIYFEYCLEDIFYPQVSSNFEFVKDEKTKYYLNRGVTYNTYTKDYEVKVFDEDEIQEDDLSNNQHNQ